MVEWKKLGEIASVSNGERPISDILVSGRYLYINAGRVNSGYLNECNSKRGAVTTPSHGEGGIGSVLFQKSDFWCGALCYKMYTSDKVINRYLYHYLCNNTDKIINCKNVGGQPYINRRQLESILIEVPSLSEQNRIVGILDTFTASIDNLKEQIAQRRKQYEYYRDQLLDLEGKEGVEMKKLEDIVSNDCSLSYGIVQPGDDVYEGIPVVRPVDLIYTFISRLGLKNTTKEISNSYKRTILRGKEILFCVRGTTGIMSLATQDLVGCNVTRGIVPISFDNEITKMFVYYQLKSSKLQKAIADKTNGTALKQINIKDLRQINLLIPPLSEQQRIVSILDTFEASIQNMEAQLSQREKQYEYYRNKLLTFE